jgi:RNA polymerase sigma-70 factor (ECF subfamily)
VDDRVREANVGAARDDAGFEAERGRLVALAYRMLGTRMDAEDVVQDAWLRLATATGDRAPRDLGPWLTRTVTHLALDRLRRRRREPYEGPWLPEPALPGADVVAETREQLGLGMLSLLEVLTPAQRAAFVLREALGEDHAAIADALGVREATARQHCRRARARLARTPPPERVGDAALRSLLDDLVGALVGGDRARLLELLHPDAVAVHDGGGRVSAAIRPIETPERIAQVYLHLVGRLPAASELRPVDLVGEPALALIVDGHLDSISTIGVRDGRLNRLFMIRNPDKLRAVAAGLGAPLAA